MNPTTPRASGLRRRTRVLLSVAGISIGLVLWLVAGFGPPPVPALGADQETVRVLAHAAAPQLLLRCESGFELLAPATGTAASERLGARLELRPQGERLLLSDGETERRLDGEVRLAWSGLALARLDPKREAQRWFGQLHVRTTAEGLRVVPHVELERYLTGVLQREMSPSFAPEALAAQAVAARSYVLEARERARKRERDYDVFGDTRSQVFRGSSEHPRILRAVAATRGMVLAFEGKLLRAYYSSTCGGRSRDGAERFRDVPAAPFAPVDCEGCRISPRHRWTRSLGLEAWKKLGLDAMPKRIHVLEKSERGDWLRLRIEDASGQERDFTGAQLRRALALPSTWIEDVTRAGEEREVHGRGFGHGVGLCQYGAEGYARAGWTWQRILQHYYPGAQVVPFAELADR